MMLLCLSSWSVAAVLEEPVEVAGEVALEAAGGFAAGFAFAGAPFDVGDRGWVCSASGDEDLVEGAVELAVAAAVEAVADRLAGGGGDRGDAGETGERGLALIRPWCDQESTTCAARSGPTPGWSSSCGASLRVSVFDLAGELALLGGQLLHAACDGAEREQRAAQLRVMTALRARRWPGG